MSWTPLCVCKHRWSGSNAIPQIIALRWLNFEKPLTLCKFCLKDVYLWVGCEESYLHFLKVKNNFIFRF